MQVMAVAPSMDTAGDATRVPAHTSDLIELVSGVCQARSRDATLARQWAGSTALPMSEVYGPCCVVLACSSDLCVPSDASDAQ